MTSTPARCRVAELRLRAAVAGRRARVYWPGPTGPPRPLLMLFDIGNPSGAAEFDDLSRTLSATGDFIVFAVRYDLRPEQRQAIESDATRALEWAADHAAELDADSARLLIGGRGAGGALATAVRRMAREQGWPPILRQLMIPTF
ncbi:alpha/beta hydrolase [Nocardia sp. SYP-A9097]|uniref:alpha/beta hydrolase n=1 Tax=Nocardia sp. SYP-A9097 TaxID=2663237 RepID=UPI001891E520|nr:alpha/beta hydrolase fold domain-containing protein [Nocardia sp. SYP-A9097]